MFVSKTRNHEKIPYTYSHCEEGRGKNIKHDMVENIKHHDQLQNTKHGRVANQEHHLNLIDIFPTLLKCQTKIVSQQTWVKGFG